MDDSDSSWENNRGAFPSLFDMPTMRKKSSMPALQGMNLPFYGMLPNGNYGSAHGSTSIDDSAMHLKQQFEARSFELQGLVERANESLKTAIGERDTAIKTAQRSELHAKGHETEIASLKSELEACKLSLQQRSERITSTVAQIERFGQDVASTKAEMKRSGMELDACRREVEQRTTTNESLTARLEASVNEVAILKAEVMNLKDQVEARKSAEDLARQTVHNVSQEFSRSTSRLQSTRSALETTQLKEHIANERVVQLERQYDSNKTAAAEERKEHTRALHSLKEEADSERRKMENRIGILSNQLLSTYHTFEEANWRLQYASPSANFENRYGSHS